MLQESWGFSCVGEFCDGLPSQIKMLQGMGTLFSGILHTC